MGRAARGPEPRYLAEGPGGPEERGVRWGLASRVLAKAAGKGTATQHMAAGSEAGT